MGAKAGQSKKPGNSAPDRRPGRQRLALLLFGALFVILFGGYAIAEGLGSPSVPEGDVALVESVPEDISTVSEADFKRALLQQAAQAQLKKPPKPGDDKYDELREAALNELIDSIWIQGEAEELELQVTPKEIATELAQIKKQNFKSEAEFQKFLQTSRFTLEDVRTRVKLQALSSQIQEKIAAQAPPADEAEIADYYETVKDTQFTTADSRDVRVVVNKDKAKVEAAQAELEKDNSAASWKKVASKYSEDPTTKTKGGLQKALTEELLQSQPELKKAIFENPTGQLAGPVDVQGNFFVIEVVQLNPEKVQPLAEVSAQIKTQLTQQVAQKVFSQFVTNYQSKWQARTFCADDFLTNKCSNFVGDGRPTGAPPACYEADPKGGLPEACPAPVTPVSPAFPGSVTLINPEGEKLPQRPRPAGLEEQPELPLGTPGTPSGAVPPGEAPPAEAPPTGE